MGRTYVLGLWDVLIHSNSESSYINGSVHIAYSLPLKKLYLGVKGVVRSPLIPKPTSMNSISLYDFSKVNNVALPN